MSDYIPHPPVYADLTGWVDLISEEPLYEGSYSKVYKGRLSHSGLGVAVKVLKPIPGKDDASLRRKMVREMTAWARVKRCEFVAKFLGHATGGKFGPLGAVISKWYENGDVQSYLERRKTAMTLWDRLDLFRDVCLGVNYLHDHGIVHGDIKPKNILINDYGSPRICDFGLATLYLTEPGSGMTTTSDYTGTPRYISPELLGLEPTLPTEASDIWAVGCVGLEILLHLQPHARRINNARGIIYQDIKAGKLPAEKTERVGLEDAIQELLHLFWHPEPEKRIPLDEVYPLIKSVCGESTIKVNINSKKCWVEVGRPCFLVELAALQKAREMEEEPCFFVRTPDPGRPCVSGWPFGTWRSEPWHLFKVHAEDVTNEAWEVYEVHTGIHASINSNGVAICTLNKVLEEYQTSRRRGEFPFPILPVESWSLGISILRPSTEWECKRWVEGR